MILFQIRFQNFGVLEFRKIESLGETTFGQFQFGLWVKRFSFARITILNYFLRKVYSRPVDKKIKTVISSRILKLQ